MDALETNIIYDMVRYLLLSPALETNIIYDMVRYLLLSPSCRIIFVVNLDYIFDKLDLDTPPS